MSTAIRTALGEAFIGDTAALKALFASPATVDARLIEMMTALGIQTDAATADDLAMLANLRLIAKEISNLSQPARIAFIQDLQAILLITGSGAAIDTYFNHKIDVPRIYPKTVVLMDMLRSGIGTQLHFTGPSNNNALIAGTFNPLLRFGPYDEDVTVQPLLSSYPIYSPATPATIDVAARPGDETVILETPSSCGITLDPKISEYRLSYAASLSNNPTRMNCILELPQNIRIHDFDFSWDIKWDYRNASGVSQTHAIYITIYSYDRDNTPHHDTLLLDSATLSAGATSSGRYILRVCRVLDLVYHGMSRVYLP